MKKVSCVALMVLALASVSLVSCASSGSGEGMSRQGKAATFRTTDQLLDDITGFDTFGPRF